MHLLPTSTIARIEDAVFFVVLVLVYWAGRKEERIASVALTGAMFFNNLTHVHGRGAVQYGEAASDFVLLVILGSIAYGSSRRWALWATAFQLLALVSFIGQRIDRTIGKFAYLTLTESWGWLVLATLIIGTIELRKKNRQPSTPRAGPPGRALPDRSTPHARASGRFGRRPRRERTIDRIARS